MTTLRAVGFDLWETLISNPAELGREQERVRVTAIASLLEEAGSAAGLDDVRAAHRSVWQRCHALYWSNDRDIACRVQVEHFLEELAIEPGSLPERVFDAIESAYARAAENVLPSVVEGAPAVLRELRERGFRIGLISNTGRTPGSSLRTVLAELGLASLIDHMVFSNEHGACKPQASIFEELTDGLGTGAHEVVFVGDNLHVDVLGAKRVGMRAVHFDPPVRGAAVAQAVDTSQEVEPDARIVSLAELPDIIERWTETR